MLLLKPSRVWLPTDKIKEKRELLPNFENNENSYILIKN